jgi:hypothetical protein
MERLIGAAKQGRIDTLFIADGAHYWGQGDETTGQIVQFTPPVAGARDLLDEAAAHTWLAGGKVYRIKASDVPMGRLAAAILRYSVPPPTDTAPPNSQWTESRGGRSQNQPTS